MDSSFKSFLKPVKLFFIVMKIGADVFVETLKLLYKRPQPIESNLVDLADNKSNNINNYEKELLKNIKKGERDLKSMDITLSYKLIQFTCGLEPKQDSLNNCCVWSKRCPKEKQDYLEHLLFRYKTERNKLAHEFTNFENISDETFEKLKNENVESLLAIVEKVGKISNLSEEEIKGWKSRIKGATTHFCQQLVIQEKSPTGSSSSSSLVSPGSSLEILHKSGEFSLDEFENEAQTRAFPAPGLSRGLDLSEILKILNTKRGIIKTSSEANFPEDLKKIIVNAFNDNSEQGNKTKPLEKCNRMYWVDKLVSSDALKNEESLKKFWKEYEEYIKAAEDGEDTV